jgi:hypothetical protein
MIKVPPLKHKHSLLGLPNSPFLFSIFPIICLTFHPFFIMSNEIIFFQILCRLLKYLFFSLMKVRLIKFIKCEPCSINDPKFIEIWFFETFYIAIGHLFLSHSYILYSLTHKVFVVEILCQKKLVKHSLWVLEFFFQATKSWIFFKGLVRIFKLVQIWHFMHRIVTLYLWIKSNFQHRCVLKFQHV